MQKIIKLTDTHYIVVDDSEIKEGNWVCNIQRPYAKQCQDIDVDYYNRRNDVFKKITHSTQPLEPSIKSDRHDNPEEFVLIKPLSLSEVEEAINGYSTYELFKKIDGSCEKGQYEHWLFEQGFNAYKELVKDKLFTVEDMRKVFEVGFNFGEEDEEVKNAFDDKTYNKDIMFNEAIQSLLPKTEWEVEFDENGKLKLV